MPDPMKYGTIFVDEKYSPILEPNLYYDSVFQPGVTFNSTYQAGDPKAGLVRVYKNGTVGVVSPGMPAAQFTHTDSSNDLIDVVLNNAFRQSRRVYQVQADNISYALADETLSSAIEDVKQGWMVSGLACLAQEGTAAALTTAITAETIKGDVIEARKAARKGKAIPKVVLASVDVFSTMLEAAGGEYTPTLNDKMMSSGQVGTWLGMTWYECNATEEAAAKYYDYTGSLKTVNLTNVGFIMYDPSALSIINNLELMRIVDSENFAGSLAQVEFNTGYRVTNNKKIVVRSVA